MRYMKKKNGVAAVTGLEICANGEYSMPNMKDQSKYHATSNRSATGIRAFSKLMAALLYLFLVLCVTQSPALAQDPQVFDLITGTWNDGYLCNGTFCDLTPATGILTIKNDAYAIEVINSVDAPAAHWSIEVAGNALITLKNVSILTTGKSPIKINSGGNLFLTLEGDNTLTAGTDYAGIELDGGTLTIEDSDGSLIVKGGDNGGAGIGGVVGSDGGTINITGGKITATGGNSGGAGIGGGATGDGGTITIDGGEITATGGEAGAGIGGGLFGDGGIIKIDGGNIVATGGSLAAGIGGGMNGDSGDILITGGNITATANSSAKGIGEGFLGTSVSIEINGDAVVVASSISNTITKTHGILFDGNDGEMFDNGNPVEPADGAIFPLDGEITIAAGQKLIITEGFTLTNNGTIYNYGEIIIEFVDVPEVMIGVLINNGTIINYGTITINGLLTNNGNITNNDGALIEIEEDEGRLDNRNGEIIDDGTIEHEDNIMGPRPVVPEEPIDLEDTTNTSGSRWELVSNVYNICLTGQRRANVIITGTSTTQRIRVNSCEAKITLDGVSITVTGAGNSPIQLNTGANVTLVLKGVNELASTFIPDGNEGAGIRVPDGAMLTINEDIDGGSLQTRSFSAAGIGGNANDGVSGTIVINGGAITSTSSTGAGIGGGYSRQGGTIEINGGNVTAISSSGAGIGGGYFSLGGIISINGGTVNARSGAGAGIGNGAGISLPGTTTFAMTGNSLVFASSVSDINPTLDNGILFTRISGTIYEGEVYGDVTLEDNLEITAGSTLTIPQNAILRVPDGMTIRNYGTIEILGMLFNFGTITCDGEIIGAVQGDGVDSECSAGPVDPTKPTVSSVTPDGTNAPVSGSLMIIFDKAMDSAPGTVQLNKSNLSGGIWINNTVYSIPYSGLAYGTQYTATISGFRDTTNNAMNQRNHSFTTAASLNTAAPTIISVTPAGTNVSVGGSLVITFSKAMNTTPGTVRLNTSNITGGSWSSGNTVYTIPYSGLTPGTLYTVQISNFRDTSNNTMTPGGHSFTTANVPDTIPPTVLSVVPAGPGAPISGNLVITFSEAMDSVIFGTVRLNNLAALAGGSWSGGNTIFTIPYSDLAYNTSYTANISDFKDVAGNTMTVSSNRSFTTGDAPNVVSVTPTGTGAPIGGNLVITFSEAMDSAINGTVRLNNLDALAGGSWSGGNTIFTIPYSDLTYNTSYAVYVSDFKNLAGYSMTVSNNRSFTTGDAPDVSAPTVVSVTPTGTGAAVGGNVVITFSKAMNTSPGTVQLNNTSLTGGSWSAGNTVFTVSYNGLAYGTQYTVNISGFRDALDIYMAASNSFDFTTGVAPILTGIPRLALETNSQGPVWGNPSSFDFIISGDGKGNFYTTISGYTGSLSIYGVEFRFENIPAGTRPTLVVERDGSTTPSLSIRDSASGPGTYFSDSAISLSHGGRAVYKLRVGNVVTGTFTVVYINEQRVITRSITQTLGSRSYWFAPVELFGTDYSYEIISRPNTIGGLAPWIDYDGRFAFAQQVMPTNVSRAGEYTVKAVNKRSNIVEVFRIDVR